MGGASQVGTCTPFVTCVIGTSSGARPGQQAPHIAREISPCRALTPFTERAARTASVDSPNRQPWSLGSSWPSPITPGPTTSTIEHRSEHAKHLSRVVRLVARGHGRVGGEDELVADGRPQRVGWCTGGEPLTRELDRGERGMALVEVEDRWLDAHGPKGPHPTDAEHRVLRQAHLPIALVEPRRHPPCHRGVPGTSVSSRYNGTRPTSTRQIRASTSSP